MSTKYLETLLIGCKEALIELDATMQPKHSKPHQAYLKVVGQLESKCSGCGNLMDINNCCVMDAGNLKIYHPGCQPQKKVEKDTFKRKISTDEKLDALLSMMYSIMKDKTNVK